MTIINPNWMVKFFAERARLKGKASQMETSKAVCKIMGAVAYKRSLQKAIEQLVEDAGHHINPSIVYTRREQLSKVLELLEKVEPTGFEVRQKNYYTAEEIRDGNREIMLFLGWTYDVEPASSTSGWHDKNGILKYSSLQQCDFHSNKEALWDIAGHIKAQILLRELGIQYKTNIVMQLNYEYTTVMDLWGDVVRIIKEIKLMRTNPNDVPRSQKILLND